MAKMSPRRTPPGGTVALSFLPLTLTVNSWPAGKSSGACTCTVSSDCCDLGGGVGTGAGGVSHCAAAEGGVLGYEGSYEVGGGRAACGCTCCNGMR